MRRCALLMESRSSRPLYCINRRSGGKACLKINVPHPRLRRIRIRTRARTYARARTRARAHTRVHACACARACAHGI